MIIIINASKSSSKINFIWMLWFKLAENRWCFWMPAYLGLYQNVSLPNEVLLPNNIENYEDL